MGPVLFITSNHMLTTCEPHSIQSELESRPVSKESQTQYASRIPHFMMIRVVVHSILISIKYLLMVGGRLPVARPARLATD